MGLVGCIDRQGHLRVQCKHKIRPFAFIQYIGRRMEKSLMVQVLFCISVLQDFLLLLAAFWLLIDNMGSAIWLHAIKCKK